MPVLRYWDVASNQYISLAGLPGAQGPTGPMGPTGPIGPTGSALSPVSVRATRAAAYTFPTSATAFVYDTEAWDTRNAYNTSNGTFTCPVAGKYRVTAQLCTSSPTAAGQTIWVNVQKNGSGVASDNYSAYSTAASQVLMAQAVDTLDLAVGDTVGFLAGASAAIALNTVAYNTFMTIDLVSSGIGPVGPTGPPGLTGPPGTIQTATSTIVAPTVAGSPYTVVHGLNTATPFVQVYDSVTNQQVQVQIQVIDVNTITVSTAQNMPNNVTVAVTGGSSTAQTYLFSFVQTLAPPTVVSSPYVVNHNLQTMYPIVQLYDAVTYTQLLAQVQIIDGNNVAISVTQNMPNPVNVVVVGQADAPVPSNPANLATKAYVDAQLQRSGTVVWAKQKSVISTGWGSTTSTTFVTLGVAGLISFAWTKLYAGTNIRVSFGCSCYNSTAATSTFVGTNVPGTVQPIGNFYHQAAATHASFTGTTEFSGIAPGSYSSNPFVRCSAGQFTSDGGDYFWWKIEEVWP